MTNYDKIRHELKEMEVKQEVKQPVDFLNAWKKGVALIGESYFLVKSATVEDCITIFGSRYNPG